MSIIHINAMDQPITCLNIKNLNEKVLFNHSYHSRVELLLSPTVLFLMNSMITLM